MPAPSTNRIYAGTSGTGTTGSGTAYGTVPGPIGIPPNVFSQISGAVPNFPGLTGGTSNVIQSELGGNVSPGTMNALKTASAQFGVANGMPGSGLQENQLFGNIAGFSEGQAHKGIQDYLSLISGVGPTMTNPNLAAEIAGRNAGYAAAPDPRLAAQEQERLWKEGLSFESALSNPSRGPWWAPGGVSTPPIGATIGRSYAGGGQGPGQSGVFDTPDAFGYNFTNPEAGTTAVLGATNPQAPYYNPNAYSQWQSNYGGLYPGLSGVGVDEGFDASAFA
jgi:hypothetical protein